MEFLKKLWNDEEGQGMVEYALIIALIAIVVAVALPFLAEAITDVFTRIQDALAEPPA